MSTTRTIGARLTAVAGGRVRRKLVAAVGTSALVLSIAACGSSGGDGPSAKDEAKYDSMSMDQLYQAAKKAGENKITLYTVLSTDDLDVIAKPFEAKYPGIKVEGVESQGEDSAAKMSEEANAGVHTVDILDTEQNTIYAISQENLLATYSPPAAKDFESQFKHPTFTGFRVQVKPMAYNTKLIKGDDIPTSYDDLVDPKYKGKICAESSEVAVFQMMIKDWGEDKTVEYWKALTANGLRFISGQTSLIESIISGDCPIATSANVHGIAPEAADGAPVAWIKTDPMYANYGAVGVAKNAPHPYAARLWENFLLSPEGQQSVADNWRIPANPAVTTKEPELADRSSYDLLVAGDAEMADATEANNLYYTSTDRPVVGLG